MTALRETRLLLAAILLPYLAWGLYYVHRTSFLLDGERVYCLWDDAMISLRYAANLVAGEGLVWNAGEAPIQGFTNLGVVLLMASVHALPGQPALWVQLVALALLGACVGLVLRLALAHGGDLLEAGTAALALVISGPLAVWGLQGADTTFVAVWLLVAVRWQQRCGETWPPSLFLWLGAGALLRLDALLFAAVFVGFGAARAFRRGALDVGAWALRGALVGVVPVAVLAFGAAYYGDPLPNTFHLKATGSPIALVLGSGLAQLAAWWGLLPALGAAGFAVWRERDSATVSLCGLLVAAALLYHVWVGGDWLAVYGSRFVVPVLPLLLWLATLGCYGLVAPVGAKLSAGAATALPVGLAILVAYLANTGPALRDWSDPEAPTMLHQENRHHARVARYLRDQTDPDTLVALHWAGVPGYFSERPAVDVLGRSDRHIARLSVPHFAPGHSKWDWDYVLGERRPDVFLIVSRGLGRRRDFARDYWHVETADGLEFFLRRDSRARLHDTNVTLEAVGDAQP